MELIISHKLQQSSERILNKVELAEEVRRGAILLDIRQPRHFAGGHLPGSLNITFYPEGYAGQVAAFVPTGRPLVLVCEAKLERLAATFSLMQAGFNLVGYTEPAFATELETLPQLTVQQLWQELSQENSPQTMNLLDVRSLAEWQDYHIEGSIYIPFMEIPRRWQELDRAIDLAVVAAKRYHSLTVITFLKQHGYDRVYEVSTGMSGWTRSGLPIRRGN